MRSIQSLIISQDDTEDFMFCREWKEERNEKRENIKESRTTIVCYRREHALDAGVHLDINAHCFFEVDGLVFLGLFSVFFGGAGDGCSGDDFGGAGDGWSGVDFGGAGDGCSGVDFGGAGDGCSGVDFGGVGDGCSVVGFGGAHLGSLWRDCSPGLRSLLGGEAVEFVLSGYGDCVDVFGVGR